MNEYTRNGKGDEYVEVCMDWVEGKDEDILWMFRECLGSDKIRNPEFKKSVKEVFELDEPNLGDL